MTRRPHLKGRPTPAGPGRVLLRRAPFPRCFLLQDLVFYFTSPCKTTPFGI